MSLLYQSDYERIRRAISHSFNEATLPDSLIRDSRVIPEAEDWTKAQTADTGKRAVRATVYYAAYLLVPSIVGQLQAAHNIVGGDGVPVKWQDLMAILLLRAEREIAAITGEELPDPAKVPGTGTVPVRIRW